MIRPIAFDYTGFLLVVMHGRDQFRELSPEQGENVHFVFLGQFFPQIEQALGLSSVALVPVHHETSRIRIVLSELNGIVWLVLMTFFYSFFLNG